MSWITGLQLHSLSSFFRFPVIYCYTVFGKEFSKVSPRYSIMTLREPERWQVPFFNPPQYLATVPVVTYSGYHSSNSFSITSPHKFKCIPCGSRFIRHILGIIDERSNFSVTKLIHSNLTNSRQNLTDTSHTGVWFGILQPGKEMSPHVDCLESQ